MIEVWKLIKSLRRRMSAFGVKRTLTRDTIGIGFLSGYAPRADTNQQILIPRKETGCSLRTCRCASVR
jgi:hypothetical protein